MPFIPAAELVRGEPDYAEQIPRLASYRHAHPGADIIYLGSWWQYILTEGNGLTVIVRFTLEELLDKLDSLDAEAGTPEQPGS
jgi:hypothetical protein